MKIILYMYIAVVKWQVTATEGGSHIFCEHLRLTNDYHLITPTNR